MKTSRILIIMMIFISRSYHAQIDSKMENELTGIQVGEKAPLFETIDQFDSLFTLYNALQEGPVVLVFYRGQWCPFCNKHLSDLQDSLKLIYDKGATVVAISPERTEYLQKMVDKTEAEFKLLYDKNYVIAESYNVLFQPDKAKRTMYNTLLNANLNDAHGNDAEMLPIPATYIIDKNGIVVWRHFDPNYKNRATVHDILEHLPNQY